jgi:hypothetical protein
LQLLNGILPNGPACQGIFDRHVLPSAPARHDKAGAHPRRFTLGGNISRLCAPYHREV